MIRWRIPLLVYNVLLLLGSFPSSRSKYVKYRGESKVDPSLFPLGECEGDCDGDKQCDIGLSCLRRDNKEQVPGCKGTGKKAKDFCYRPGKGILVVKGLGDMKPDAFPLGECEGGCQSDGDCDFGLVCFARKENETVPGCSGEGINGLSYCYKPPKGVLVKVGDDGKPAKAFPLGECQGDCESDADCELGLACFQRKPDKTDAVPGCRGKGQEGKDYCGRPHRNHLVMMGDDGSPEQVFPLGECQGDCESDEDCQPGLWCFQRKPDRTDKVPGCQGKGVPGKDYCYNPGRTIGFPELAGGLVGPPPRLPLIHKDTCSKSSPCGECQGDCKRNNKHCRSDLDLKCLARPGHEAVPGCVTGGSGDVVGASYCVDSKVQTYVAGQPSVVENGLLLSKGLTAKLIATTDETVKYTRGGESDVPFHIDPDGGAVFSDPSTGGWIYVSNAETSQHGGVGAITFDSNGHVVKYERVLTNTRRNCGGGKTFWNTWLSCEEDEGGQIWEVDPWGKKKGRQTLIGGAGDRYESAAYDNRIPTKPTFYVTTDLKEGPLVRFTPDEAAVITALSTNDYSNLLHTNRTGTAKIQYLVVTPDPPNRDRGDFTWTDNISKGRASASNHFPNCEGIDIRDGRIYVTCKKENHLFIFDIDNLTYERSSTVSGAFDGSPDQVASIVGDRNEVLYFCEEGGDTCGVHGRDGWGNFFTILEKYEPEEQCETTGLAFSPDNKHMYVSFQEEGKIFDITRTDGFEFGGSKKLDIKWHAK